MEDFLDEFKTSTSKYEIVNFNHNTSLEGRISSYTSAAHSL